MRENTFLMTNERYDIKKLRMHAFAASVFSAPHLKPDGSIMSLEEEKVSRNLTKDLCKLAGDYKAGAIFFTPTVDWVYERSDNEITKQGALLIPDDASFEESERIRKSDRFYRGIIRMCGDVGASAYISFLSLLDYKSSDADIRGKGFHVSGACTLAADICA